jgi:RimJ/RimL family protein N-acetyltransferase
MFGLMEEQGLKGNLVMLRPAMVGDRRAIYEWLAKSDITSSMMGPPIYPEHKIPTWQEFCDDYVLHYFSEEKPELGRCFVIVVDGEDIGQVNYNSIDELNKRTELDIWMSSEANCGKGSGPDALETLCGYLFEKFGVSEFFIQPSARNQRAIQAYEKAGFKKISLSLEEAKAEYGPVYSIEPVYMVKKMGH